MTRNFTSETLIRGRYDHQPILVPRRGAKDSSKATSSSSLLSAPTSVGNDAPINRTLSSLPSEMTPLVGLSPTLPKLRSATTLTSDVVGERSLAGAVCPPSDRVTCTDQDVFGAGSPQESQVAICVKTRKNKKKSKYVTKCVNEFEKVQLSSSRKSYTCGCCSSQDEGTYLPGFCGGSRSSQVCESKQTFCSTSTESEPLVAICVKTYKKKKKKKKVIFKTKCVPPNKVVTQDHSCGCCAGEEGKCSTPAGVQTPSVAPTATVLATSQGLAATGLVVVNSETERDMFALVDGQVLVLDKMPPFTIRAVVSGSPGSVWFWVNGDIVKREGQAPYSISGDRNGDYKEWDIDPGVYTITVTPYSERRGSGTVGVSLTMVVKIFPSARATPVPVAPTPMTPAPVTPAPVTPAPVTPAPVKAAPVTSAPVTPSPVTPAPATPAPVATKAPIASGPVLAIKQLMVVNAKTDEDMSPLAYGQVLNPEIPFTIRADVIGSVGSVVFWVNNKLVQTESVAPYSLSGDSNGDFKAWKVDPGQYVLKATPFSERGGKGTQGRSLTTFFKISTAGQAIGVPPTTPKPTVPPVKTPTDKPTLYPVEAPSPKPIFPTRKPSEGNPGTFFCTLAEKDGRASTAPLNRQAGDVIQLARSPQLCSLWQVDPSRSQIVPVGRSYQGNAWEPYAGKFDQVKFACDATQCSLTLPELPEGFTYELAGFDYELPREDEVARFLEQASFGPTRETISSFPKTFAEWIKQQQEVIPMSSHREFFRERASFRSDETSSRGINSNPCKAGSRYRRYTFTRRDFQHEVEIRTDDKTGRKILLIKGQTRTVLDTSSLNFKDGEYKMCSLGGNQIGASLRLKGGSGCIDLESGGKEVGNPNVFFDSQTPPNIPTLKLDGKVSKLSDEELYLSEDLEDPKCSLLPPQRGTRPNTFAGSLNGEMWLFDSQVRLQENTMEKPLMDGGGPLVEQTLLTEEEEEYASSRTEAACANAPMTFLNENYCQLSYEPGTCSQQEPPGTPITLNVDTLRRIYDATGGGKQGSRYVYSVEGLRQVPGSIDYGPPCTPGETSRWVKVSDCSAEVAIRWETTLLFRTLLSNSDDKNPFLRDITFPLLGAECHAEDIGKYDFKIKINGQCWLNVHRSHLQVFDFSEWVNEHNGGPEKIKQFTGDFRLKFPSWHDMKRWYGAKDFRSEVGRFGDIIPFSQFPAKLTTKDIAIELNALAGLPFPAVVCGTPGEVESKLSSAGPQFNTALRVVTNVETVGSASEQKDLVWLAIALNCKDGLRQRVAWTLSQILVATGHEHLTETRLNFYDVSDDQ